MGHRVSIQDSAVSTKLAFRGGCSILIWMRHLMAAMFLRMRSWRNEYISALGLVSGQNSMAIANNDCDGSFLGDIDKNGRETFTSKVLNCTSRTPIQSTCLLSLGCCCMNNSRLKDLTLNWIFAYPLPLKKYRSWLDLNFWHLIYSHSLGKRHGMILFTHVRRRHHLAM